MAEVGGHGVDAVPAARARAAALGVRARLVLRLLPVLRFVLDTLLVVMAYDQYKSLYFYSLMLTF